MKIYDREGNEIQLVGRYNPRDVVDPDSYIARITKQRQAQLRMTPTVWWLLMMVAIVSVPIALACYGTGIVLRSWYPEYMGLLFTVLAAGTGIGLVAYHDKHGFPKKVKEEPPKPKYCDKCQAELENQLDIANQQRLQEAMDTIAELTDKGVPVPELEARINRATTDNIEAATRQ